MRLHRFFSRAEFTCHCGCERNTVDAELLTVLVAVRKHFNRPVTVTSGYRCILHNVRIRGSKKSRHLIGKAADIVVSGVHADRVADWLEHEFYDCYGIGRYDIWTHIDVRTEKARWDKRGQ